jgi:hypothetical protein
MIFVSLFDALSKGLARHETGWTRQRLIPHSEWRASNALCHYVGDVQVPDRDFSIVFTGVRYPMQHPDIFNFTTTHDLERGCKLINSMHYVTL